MDLLTAMNVANDGDTIWRIGATGCTESISKSDVHIMFALATDSRYRMDRRSFFASDWEIESDLIQGSDTDRNGE